VNRPAGVALNGDLQLLDSLIQRNGSIAVDPYLLTLGSSSASPGSLMHDEGAITGALKRWVPATTGVDLVFPLGDTATPPILRYATVRFTTAPTSGGSITARFTSGYPGTGGLPLLDSGVLIENIGSEGSWSLTPGDGIAGGVFDLDLTASGFQSVSNVSSLRILSRSVSGSWAPSGMHVPGTGSLAEPEAHRSDLVDPVEFGIGGTFANPLPVEIDVFSADVQADGVHLMWRTNTEVNNHGFEVQRRGAIDDNAWLPLGFVQGAGSSNVPRTYAFTDAPAPIPGEALYRLKQIDRDGSCEYSKIVHAIIQGPRDFELYPNFPNPFSTISTIAFHLPRDGFTSIKLYEMNGRLVKTIRDEYMPAGFNSIVMDVGGLSPGSYRYIVTSGSASRSGTILIR
jgi:hypothetical protein